MRTSDDKRHFPRDFGKTSRASEDVLRKSEINSGGIEAVRTASASVDNRLAYTMPGSVQATIMQNLNVV